MAIGLAGLFFIVLPSCLMILIELIKRALEFSDPFGYQMKIDKSGLY
jgi:hypothetical protein